MAAVAVLDDAETLAGAAAERITALVEAAVDTAGEAFVGLTGGRTPRRLYELLADPGREWRSRIPWHRLHLFWSDERRVPPDDPESNFGLAHRTLLSRVPVPPSRVYRIPAELPDAPAAARAYDLTLRAAFVAAGRSQPAADVLLLGLGEDAHIASIFPGGPPAAHRSTQLAEAVLLPRLGTWRITLTPHAILAAQAIVVVAAGEAKADALHAALEGVLDVERWPAQRLRAAGDRVSWLVDAAAAARLSPAVRRA